MVAGVIAACAATAGELPRPVKILSVRAIPEGDEYDRDVAAAIRYAVDNGAEVVNMSFGKYLSPHRDEVLAAMKYARSKDVLLVMASGNDGVNVDVRPIFPTCRDTKGRRLENQIVVGASTPDGRFFQQLRSGKCGSARPRRKCTIDRSRGRIRYGAGNEYRCADSFRCRSGLAEFLSRSFGS